jgi:hypothetical protein
MGKHKMKFRIALIVVVAVSVVVCPLSWGGWSLRQGAFAEEGGRQQPFTFVPSLSGLEVTRTVEGPALGAVTPVPTPGAGQYFEEEDEERLPPVENPQFLEEPFGYTEILGHPGLYLVWSTDDDGNKRYFIVEEGNTEFVELRTAVNDFTAARDLFFGQAPLLRHIVGSVGTGFFLWTSLQCVGGAIATLLAEPIAAPLTAALIGCTFVSLGLAWTAAMVVVNNIGAFWGYLQALWKAHVDVEGNFQQLTYHVEG